MTKINAIFISDLHLGSTQCSHDILLDFLKNHECKTLYLVGDIIDFWALASKSYWPHQHNSIVQRILKMAKHGTKVIYVPGNHDSNMRDMDGYTFGNIEIHREYVHHSVTGHKYLLVHGDEYDTIAKYYEWVSKLGSHAYDLLIDLNRIVRVVSRYLGYESHFSLSAYVKYRVKEVVKFISDYELAIVSSLKDRGIDGVICGHIHHAEIREIDGIAYMNCGDFVESCTALVEWDNGRFEIIDWPERGKKNLKLAA